LVDESDIYYGVFFYRTTISGLKDALKHFHVEHRLTARHKGKGYSIPGENKIFQQ
jgi:hypothetical protein